MKVSRNFATRLLLVLAAILGYVAGRNRGAEELRSLAAQLEGIRREVAGLKSESQTSATAKSEGLIDPVRPAQPPSKSANGKRADFTPLDTLRVLGDLQQRKLVRPWLTIFDQRGRIDESFASLFDLKPGEREYLQRAIDEARERLGEMERSNATVTRDGDGNIVVSVRPFPQEGGQVYDAMMQRVADLLGPERNDAFRKMGAEQVELSLGRFGSAERTYTFGYDRTERSEQPYTVQDRVMQKSPTGRVDGTTDNARFSTFENLAARFGPIVSLLPPEYRRPK